MTLSPKWICVLSLMLVALAAKPQVLSVNKGTTTLGATSGISTITSTNFVDINNVKYWGAVGDGVANDTAAFLAIFAYVTNGMHIYVPKGTYLINSTLAARCDSIQIEGDASAYSYDDRGVQGSVLKYTGGTIGLDLSTNLYWRVTALTFNGNATLQDGIKVSNAHLIDHVLVTNCTQAGIHLGDSVNSTHISTVGLRGNSVGLLSDGTSSTTFTVKDSNIRENGIGILVKSGIRITIEDCVIESNRGYGLEIVRSASKIPACISVVRGWLENNSTISNSFEAHLVTTDAGNNPTDITFDGTRFYSNLGVTNGAVWVEHGKGVRFIDVVLDGVIDTSTNAIRLGANSIGTTIIGRYGGSGVTPYTMANSGIGTTEIVVPNVTPFSTTTAYSILSTNVGIATTNPAVTLEVNGDIRVTRKDVNTQYFQLSGRNANDAFGIIGTGPAGNSKGLEIENASDTSSASRYIQFLIAGANAVFIDTDRNVGIGNTSPKAVLDVTGDIRASTTMTATNGFLVRPGTATVLAKVGGDLKVDTATTGNVGGGEDTLITYSVPANTLSANGQYIDFDVWGSFAANANTKELIVYYGGTKIADSGAGGLILNGLAWRVHGKIIRTGATTQTATAELTVGGTLLSGVNGTVSFTTAPTETLSGAVTFKCTGTDSGIVPVDNSIVENGMVLKWQPGN